MEEKREELEILMETIDEKQKEVDNIQAENAELKIKVQELRSNLKKERIVNSLQKLNTVGEIVREKPVVDISQYNEEHQELIKTLKNKIEDTAKKADQNKDFNQGLEKEIYGLIASNSEMENKLQLTELKIKQSRRAQQSMNSEAEMIRSQIHSIEGDISSISRDMRSNDKKISTMTQKKAMTLSTERSPESLDKEIESVKLQIESCRIRIDELEEVKNNLDEEIKAMDESREQQMSHYSNIIGWQEEKQNLTNQRNSFKNALLELKRTNAESDTNVSTLQKRYGILRNLYLKWKKEDLSQFEQEANNDSALTIDSLLSKITALKQKSENGENNQSSISKTPDRSNMKFKYENGDKNDRSAGIKKLEEKINQIQIEYDRKLNTYRTNEYLHKNSIDQQRVLMFDQETDLINKINDTKLKIALKKLNQ